jgi:hypothetical protein
MNLRAYLPSSKFVVMVGSLALSAGLVIVAQYVTRPPESSLNASVDQASTQAADWQESLREVEAQSGVQAPQAPDPSTVNTLLSEAETSNLTTSVGRSLLINLSNASSQGLGQDDPTQNQLIAQAAAQINASASSTAYTAANLTVVAPNHTSLTAYGNGVMSVLLAHPEASAQATLEAVGQAGDTGKKDSLSSLSSIEEGYKAITLALLALPVPQTLAPLHLQLVNDYAAMAASYSDMSAINDDPLRGLAAVQRYSGLMDEATRVFTNIAQTLNKDGILFNKDEPGSNWSAFLSQ